MGGDAPPEFDLPRKAAFELLNLLVFARIQVWPCNWFQMIENSLDAVHVSFVHLAGKVGPFGEAVTAAIPKLDYSETDAGIRQVATRSETNVRISDWSFPNNNHIVTPGRTKDAAWVHRGVWNVPVDDTHTYKVGVYAIPSAGAEADGDSTSPVMCAFEGSKPRIAIDDTDFPEPDSPTIPSVSDGATS